MTGSWLYLDGGILQRPPSAAAEDRNFAERTGLRVRRWQRPPSAAAEDRNLRSSLTALDHDPAAAAVRGGRGSQLPAR